jgi:hypothetical protein
MESERAERSEIAGDRGSKRPYRTPKLRRLGTVRELTLTGGTMQQHDNPLVPTKMTP